MPAPLHQPAWRRMMARRLAIVGGVFALCVAAVIVRLVILQVFQDDFLAERSREQLEDVMPAPAQRGEILDRTGRVLATSVDWRTSWSSGRRSRDPAKAAAALCEALGDCDARSRRGSPGISRSGRARAAPAGR